MVSTRDETSRFGDLTGFEREFGDIQSRAAARSLLSVCEGKWVNSEAAVQNMESNKLLQQTALPLLHSEYSRP